jgi:SMP-30/Gluconolactonase/LRE-like region
VVADDVKIPDGLAFSPDEKVLFIEDDGSNPPSIRAYDVVADGTRLANGRVFVGADKGRGDGLCVDVDGNLWCGWALDGLDGVMVFNKAGGLSGASNCRSVAPMCASAAIATAACSWRRADRSIRCGSGHPGPLEAEARALAYTGSRFILQRAGDVIELAATAHLGQQRHTQPAAGMSARPQKAAVSPVAKHRRSGPEPVVR